jgi:uncharacterized membrane-anchored protein YjiN (DUF445 family)
MNSAPRSGQPAQAHEPDTQRKRLARMRAFATGLLALALAVYVLMVALEPGPPALGYVRAFAEAAIIGGLADWFAVTALFRHPLGIPIPHTAILPRGKERIADMLGTFIERNFLDPEVMAARLKTRDMAEMGARWLLDHGGAARVATVAAEMLPRLLETVSDERMQRFLVVQAKLQLRRVELAPLAGDLVALLTARGGDHDIIDEMLVQAERLLREHEPVLREQVRGRTAWVWQKLGLDDKVSDRIIAAIEETLQEIAADPQHEWRKRFRASLERFVGELKNSQEYRLKGRRLMARLLSNPLIADYAAAIWDEIRQRIRAEAQRPESRLRTRVEALLQDFAQEMLRDAPAREALNTRLAETVITLVRSQQSQISAMISETVRRWDTRTFVERIELAVGRDLQYIRINGMVVGGLIGLVIHTVRHVLPG